MNVLGMLAAIVSTFSIIPYCRDTLAGKTRPHRTTWMLLSLLAIGFVYSQATSGLNAGGLYLGVAQMIVVMVVFALSIRHGEGGVTTFEVALSIIAVISLVIGLLQKQGDATLRYT